MYSFTPVVSIQLWNGTSILMGDVFHPVSTSTHSASPPSFTFSPRILLIVSHFISQISPGSKSACLTILTKSLKLCNDLLTPPVQYQWEWVEGSGGVSIIHSRCSWVVRQLSEDNFILRIDRWKFVCEILTYEAKKSTRCAENSAGKWLSRSGLWCFNSQLSKYINWWQAQLSLRKDISESFRKLAILSMLPSCCQRFIFVCWIRRYLKANSKINKIDLMIAVDLLTITWLGIGCIAGVTGRWHSHA